MVRDFAVSITRLQDYVKLKDNPLWKVILYLLILSLVFGSLVSVSTVNRYTRLLTLIAETYDAEIPDFTIENGRMVLKENERVVIERDNRVLIFDSGINKDESELNIYKQGMLFLEEEFVIKISQNNYITRRWTEFFASKTDKSELRNSLGMIPGLLIVATVGMNLFFLLSNVLISIFVTGAVLLLKRLWSRKIKLLEAYKISVYSLTLPIVLIACSSIIIGDFMTLSRYFYFYYISVLYIIFVLKQWDPSRVS
jgi:hypothetical protein